MADDDRSMLESTSNRAAPSLAVYPDDGTDADVLLRVADQRLLQAKRAGRNRVIHALGTSSRPFDEAD